MLARSSVQPSCSTSITIIWLLHNLVEASFDLFRHLLLGDQLKPWELHPLVSYTSKLCVVYLTYLVAARGFNLVRRLSHGSGLTFWSYTLCALLALSSLVPKDSWSSDNGIEIGLLEFYSYIVPLVAGIDQIKYVILKTLPSPGQRVSYGHLNRSPYISM